MSSKWYVEFLIVLTMIAMGIICALNVNFTAPPKTMTYSDVAKEAPPEKPSPEKVRWLAGRSTFRANCAGCHNINFDGVGPVLKGVTGRWKAAGSYEGKTGDQWMHIWIRNWHDVVNAGYKYGIDLSNSRPAQMNIFVGLTDPEIDNILFYIESPDMSKPEERAQK